MSRPLVFTLINPIWEGVSGTVRWEKPKNLSLKLQLGYWDLVHFRTLLAVAERFVGVGCSLVTSLTKIQWNTWRVLRALQYVQYRQGGVEDWRDGAWWCTWRCPWTESQTAGPSWSPPRPRWNLHNGKCLRESVRRLMFSGRLLCKSNQYFCTPLMIFKSFAAWALKTSKLLTHCEMAL